MAGGKCEKCGSVEKLTFHHLEPKKKKFGLNSGNLKTKNWDRVLEEFNKCSLLCLPCHEKEHR
jgi:hypothetical protein